MGKKGSFLYEVVYRVTGIYLMGYLQFHIYYCIFICFFLRPYWIMGDCFIIPSVSYIFLYFYNSIFLETILSHGELFYDIFSFLYIFYLFICFFSWGHIELRGSVFDPFSYHIYLCIFIFIFLRPYWVTGIWYMILQLFIYHYNL